MTALPCRPTIACTADIVPHGYFELEVGYLFQRTPSSLEHSTPLLAKLSVADWLQIQIATTLTNANGASAGLKFHLLDQNGRAPSLAWSVTATLTQGSPSLAWVVYVSKDHKWLHVDFNAGVTLLQLDTAGALQPWASLVLAATLPKGFSLMLENYFFAISQANGGTLVAAAYAPRSSIIIDLGADVGWLWSQRSVSAFVGLTVAPFRIWR